MLDVRGPKSDSYFRHFKFAELDPYQFEANIPLIQKPVNQFE